MTQNYIIITKMHEIINYMLYIIGLVISKEAKKQRSKRFFLYEDNADFINFTGYFCTHI